MSLFVVDEDFQEICMIIWLSLAHILQDSFHFWILCQAELFFNLTLILAFLP